MKDIITDYRSTLPSPRRGIFGRVSVVMGLLAGLRRHDFRAAATFINAKFTGRSLPTRLTGFVGWLLKTAFVDIPDGLVEVTWKTPVSKVPIWLAEGNPLANYPFAENPQATLPEEAEIVAIGAGFTGSSLAYHWSKLAQGSKTLVLLEMGDAASGSSGRNEGVVVMGRYYAYVHKTVLAYLDKAKKDLTAAERDLLAQEFASAYCKAAYANADMIEETIRSEGFDCDYHRKGWVQASDAEHQEYLHKTVDMARKTGFTDWTSIPPEQVREISGMETDVTAGFSVAAATFHPAKWVWCLIRTALKSRKVQFFSRTKVTQVEDVGEHYLVHTERGTIKARYVVNATESYTPLLHKQFHDVILPMQTQAAFGAGAKNSLKPHVAASNNWGFFGRHGNGMLFGADATRVPDKEAGIIQPSRFITKFLLGMIPKLFGKGKIHVINEWSGTVSYTPDEFPLVGVMDWKRQYIIGGMAGSGTGVSFNAARHVTCLILGLDQPNYYPEKYFSPMRFLSRAQSL